MNRVGSSLAIACAIVLVSAGGAWLCEQTGIPAAKIFIAPCMPGLMIVIGLFGGFHGAPSWAFAASAVASAALWWAAIFGVRSLLGR